MSLDITRLTLDANAPRSLLFYGPPGSGKTTLAALLKHKNKLWIDVDQKLASQANIPEDKRSHISVWTPNVGLSEDKHVAIIRKEQHDKKGNIVPGTADYIPENPLGFKRVVDFINSLLDMDPFPYDLVVLDSLTRLVEHMERLILSHHKVATLSLPLWGVYKSQINDFIGGFLRLPCDRIVIAHSKTMQDELTQEVTIRPMVDGQTADKLPKDFNEVYYFLGKDRKDGKYHVLTRSDRKYVARTTFTFGDDEIVDNLIERL